MSTSRLRALRFEGLESRALFHGEAAPTSEPLAVTQTAAVAAISAQALLPDLTPWASESNGFVYDWAVQGDLLRLTTAMANIGKGRMELRGGATNGNTQDVWQRVYEPGGTYTDVLAGTFIYHAEHGHIHFENFAQYRLRTIDANAPDTVGEILRTGGKVSFCLLDVERYNTSLAGAPTTPFFRTCGQVQGISVGWADVYDRGLPGQSIDIADVPNGTYWLEVEVDPDNKLIEANETNNITRIQITLNRSGGGSTGIPQDAFEPNNSFATASILAPPEDHVYNNLSIHAANNADWYRVSATSDGTLAFRLAFQNSQGDIDLELYDTAQRRLSRSISTGNSEQVSVQALAGQQYYVRVYGYNGATNRDYTLTVDQPEDQGHGGGGGGDTNQAPTLTTISTLTGGTEDTAFTISYATLAGAADEVDPEGDPVRFRISEVTSGTLRKNGAVVVPGTTLLSTGESLVWTPDANANGTGSAALPAFKVVAFDGSLASASPVQVKVNVAAVNDRPTLTSISTISGARRNTPFTISYNTLLAASNAADVDAGTTLRFRIMRVDSGTLRKISASGVVTTITNGSTTIGPGESLRWTPTSSTGARNAFRVRAYDGSLESATTIQVRVNVTT